MKYYRELIEHTNRSMRDHPRSTVVVDSGNFKIIARDRNPSKLTRKLQRAKPSKGVPVVFERPDANVVWILRNHSVL